MGRGRGEGRRKDKERGGRDKRRQGWRGGKKKRGGGEDARMPPPPAVSDLPHQGRRPGRTGDSERGGKEEGGCRTRRLCWWRGRCGGRAKQVDHRVMGRWDGAAAQTRPRLLRRTPWTQPPRLRWQKSTWSTRNSQKSKIIVSLPNESTLLKTVKEQAVACDVAIVPVQPPTGNGCSRNGVRSAPGAARPNDDAPAEAAPHSP